MSIYGALYAGVAGLGAQSNKIGFISDNIANVNTVGYKEGNALFQTLVTNSSGSAYSPGGVIGGGRQSIDKQGLLQSTSSVTDIAISGEGFFVVNQNVDKSGQVLFTRAGSFTQDSTGNFRNAAGYYLQAWPLDREGRLPGEPGNLNTISSANLDSLQTVNVQNLTGAAAATTRVSIGANLNSSESNYSGASGTVLMDALNTTNYGIKAKDIIVPGGPNSLARGDKFTVTTGSGLGATYRYGGFTYSRDVTTAVNGDNGQDLLAAQAVLGTTDVSLNPVLSLNTSQALGSLPIATTLNSDVVTVTQADHGLSTGDVVTIAGNTATVGGITSGNLNGTFTITVVDANHYTYTAATTATSTATGGTGSLTSTVVPFTTDGSTSTVIVTAPNHGFVDGQAVTIAGNTATVGGITSGNLNRTNVVITVIDDGHFSYTAGAASNSAASGGTGTLTTTGLPFTTGTSGTGTVTITSKAHGLRAGDYITLSGMTGSTTVDGITDVQLSGTFRIVTTPDSDHYTITTVGTATSGDTSGGTGTIEANISPFSVTANSNQVTVYQQEHGLKTGDVVVLTGNTQDIGTIPASNINGTFVVTVVDDNHYTITAATTSTVNGGGGTGTIIANTRPFAGYMLDAINPTQPFLGVTGTSQFNPAALGFSITTPAVGSVNFTYTSASPNAQLGQFNNLNNLADAINAVAGLSARVVNNRLYVGATDANAAITFTNGAERGVAGPPVLYGIDWVRELGFADLGIGTDRFSSMEGLAKLVNNTPGLKATISNPLASSSLKITVNDPLNTITFSDVPVAAPLNAFTSSAPFTMTAGSNVVTVTHPGKHGFVTGDIVHIDAGSLPGAGPYNGIPKEDLTGDFVITVTSTTTYTITVADKATVSGPGGGAGLLVTPPNNGGSVLATLGLVPTLNGADYTPQTTGALGPAYDPTNSAKNMASGSIAAQFSRPVTIYDAQGTAHNLTASFIKTAPNTWAVEVFANASEVTSTLPNGQITYGSITFNGDGSLRSVSASLAQEANINWTNGSAPSVVSFNWGTAGQPAGTLNASDIGKTDGLSQFNSGYKVNFVNQNGAPVGELVGVAIDSEGYIIANYNNGENQKLYKIPLAKFANPNELLSSSGNAYAQTTGSGEVNLRQASTSGVGKVASSSLEASNVELAQQLTDMIVAQRAYQANTKVISTADTLLDNLNQILR